MGGVESMAGNPAAPPYSNGPYKTDQFWQFTGGLAGRLKGVGGHIFYVDEENGNDANNGLSPSKAFATLEKCFGNTTGNKVARDDYDDDAEYYVFVFPGTYTPTLDLRLYGHGIHLIGLGNPGSDSGVNISDAGESVENGSILLAGANCTIENIQFNTSTALPAIYAIATDNTVIRNCVFKGTSGTSVNAIQGDDVRGTEISYCTFGVAGGDYANNIYMTGGADQYCIDSWVHHNRISSNETSSTGILVDNTCTAYGNVFERNFINLTGTTPKGIDVNSTGVNVIADNYVVITSGATPIESASSPTGMIGNHTIAGTTVVDPNPAKT